MVRKELQNLTKELSNIRGIIVPFIRSFNNFSRNFNRINPLLHNYLRNANRNLQNPNPNPVPTTGTTGTSETGGNTDRNAKIFEAGLLKYSNELKGTILNLDKLQQRAMASNTTLAKLNLQQLDLRFSELAGEMLTLREEGFRNVNTNTLKLISTMKMTGQGTASLIKFLSKNSSELFLNTRQSQDLADRLSDTARTYGVTQERMFEFSNNLVQALGAAPIIGKGEELTGAFAKVAAKLGGRADELLTQYAKFVTDASTDAAQFALRSWSINDKLLKANADSGARLLEQSIRTSGQTIKSFMKGAGGGRIGLIAAESMAPMFGGMQQVKVTLMLNKMLDEQVTATEENNQNLTTLRTAQERYADAMERAAKDLTKIVSMLPKPATQTAAGIGGALATGLGAAGMGMIAKRFLTGAIARVAGGAALGSIVPGAGTAIGAIIGVGGALWSLKEVWDVIQESNKNSENALDQINKKTPEIKKDNGEEDKSTNLLDILTVLTQQFAPTSNNLSKENLEIQRQQASHLMLIADKLDNISRSARPALSIQR